MGRRAGRTDPDHSLPEFPFDSVLDREDTPTPPVVRLRGGRGTKPRRHKGPTAESPPKRWTSCPSSSFHSSRKVEDKAGLSALRGRTSYRNQGPEVHATPSVTVS